MSRCRFEGVLLAFSFLQIVMNPENTIFDAKHLSERKLMDPDVQSDMKNWSFRGCDIPLEMFWPGIFRGEMEKPKPD